MRIGLVGKPNVGKSTFFSAATQTKVNIANYPFCTIEPNVGVAFLPAPNDCPCKELREQRESEGKLEPIDSRDSRDGSICNPRTGSCENFTRMVPTFLVDVAGLVPGAHIGRGRGNAFLSDLARCDALIQIVDAAGTTDIEGNPIGINEDTEVCSESMLEEYRFFVQELSAWLYGIIDDGWIRGIKKAQAEGDKGLLTYLHEKLSGLGISLTQLQLSLESFNKDHEDAGNPWDWGATYKQDLAVCIRKHLFPIYVAANKAELTNEDTWKALAEQVQLDGGILLPSSADCELALRRAAKIGLIHYTPGDSDFEITELGKSKLRGNQAEGLEKVRETMKRLNGTGVGNLISLVLYEKLQHIVIYPVQDETHWMDGEKNVLPDAFVVPDSIEAKDLAYHIHSDLGDGFIRAVDCRTKRIIGAEHELSDNDVIKIHSK